MKITNLRLYPVAPRWLFLAIDTDAGVVGWGEPVIEGRAQTVAAAVNELAPTLSVKTHGKSMIYGKHFTAVASTVAGLF